MPDVGAGIGGVHRGAETSMDISADLVDLGRTPMAVVCAGAKSILDIPRTLEYLETQGVCVAAYQSDEFPAFFTPSSGCQAPCRVEDPQQAAGLVASSLQLGLNSGVLIGMLAAAAHLLIVPAQIRVYQSSLCASRVVYAVTKRPSSSRVCHAAG